MIHTSLDTSLEKEHHLLVLVLTVQWHTREGTRLVSITLASPQYTDKSFAFY